MNSYVTLTVLPFIACSACTGEPSCETVAVIPIDVISGELAFAGWAEAGSVSCPATGYDFCQFEDGGCGPGRLKCSPPLDLAAGGGNPGPAQFALMTAGPSHDGDQTTRRMVEVVSDLGFRFGFDLPDARELEGEVPWSSILTRPLFGFEPMNPCGGEPGQVLITGTVRVLFRVGGADGERGVTPDYRAVVQVSGTTEPLVSSGQSGECLSFPAIELEFTYEESDVDRIRLCQV